MTFRSLFLAGLLAVSVAANMFAQGPPPPPVPTNLTAAPAPMGAVRLEWQSPNGLWMYRVYRSQHDTAHFQLAAQTPTKWFVNHNLQPGSTYYYRVTSSVFNNGTIIESPPSNVVSYTPPIPVPPLRGTIAGDVVDDSTGLPIRQARISFFRTAGPGNWAPHVFTDSLGRYHAVLDTGSYIIRAEKGSNSPATPGYRPEWFDNVTDPSLATRVAVAESSVSIANFGLSRPAPPSFAFITGTVTDSAGTPLRAASVTIMRTLQSMSVGTAGDNTHGVVWRGRTDSLGNYSARVISGQSYIAMAAKHGYLPEYFDNETNPMNADVIPVNGDVGGINFSLATRVIVENSVSGRVRDSLDSGVRSRIVLLPVHHHPGPGSVRFGHTDSLGNYTIEHVREGHYFVLAIPFHQYAPAFYKAGAYGVRRWQDADTVHGNGNVTGVDVGVVRFGGNGLASVGGHILSEVGAPAEGVVVYAMDGNSVLGYTVTDATGAYRIAGLPSGAVTVIAAREGYNSSETAVMLTDPTGSVGGVNLVITPPVVSDVETNTGTPEMFELQQNYPNPFNPSTAIRFTLPVAGSTSLVVYNLIGQEVSTLVSDVLQAGTHTVQWHGKDRSGFTVASGLYFYRLTVQTASGQQVFNEIKKMALVK